MERVEQEVILNKKVQTDTEEKERKSQELAIYKEELKEYERLGALKFQELVFKIEKMKFKVLKRVCPNFIKYFDKYADWKKNKKIKKVKRVATRRERIKEKSPYFLKYYDKIESLQNSRKIKSKEAKDNLRKKVKASHPKLLEFYDRYLKETDIYEGLTPEEQIQMAISISKISKMTVRKEFYQEKNANYHMNSKYPTSMKKYLQWNKKIHVRGILANFITLPVLFALLASGFLPAIPLIAMEIASIGINFECINIQNYNLCRFKITEDALKRQEQRKISKRVKNYGEASKVIYKSLATNENLPSISDIISGIDNIEQARQLRELIKEVQSERCTQIDRRKTK